MYAIWFQNHRARHKSKLLEEEFAKLKQAHAAAIIHKCHLENEAEEEAGGHGGAAQIRRGERRSGKGGQASPLTAETSWAAAGARARAVGSHAVSSDGGRRRRHGLQWEPELVVLHGQHVPAARRRRSPWGRRTALCS